MTTHYIVESSALPATELTFGYAKNVVARVIGNEGDSRSLQAASDAIRHAIADWNRRLAMEWNVLTHTDISVTAGDDTYDLPSDFLHVYDVRMENNGRPLFYVEQREYDRSIWQQDQTSYTTHYTLFGHAQTGQIVLIPKPSESDTMILKYYKSIVNPTSDTDKFALPERYVWGIIAKAKALVLMDRDADNNRIGMWLREAEAALRDARWDDANRPDDDNRFVPQMEHGSKGFHEGHPYFWVDGGGF